jgi:hypothetical protein
VAEFDELAHMWGGLESLGLIKPPGMDEIKIGSLKHPPGKYATRWDVLVGIPPVNSNHQSTAFLLDEWSVVKLIDELLIALSNRRDFLKRNGMDDGK